MRSVEVLYFDGCPNADPARELVERVAADEGIEIEMRMTEVSSATVAARLRFLGSPSIRVDGADVEPEADARDSFVYACRIYRTAGGLSGVPAEEWVRTALVKVCSGVL